MHNQTYGMHARLSLLNLCIAGCLATPVLATPTIEAPEPLRRLLLRHMNLPETFGNTVDDAAQAALLRHLRKDAGELLATEGYFSPRIELTAGRAELRVEPGPRAQIDDVRIEIRGPLAAERRKRLIAEWALPSGTPFRQSAWDNAKQGLLRELLAVDHADARLLSSRAEVNVETARVNLHLVYEAGPLYRYGELRILGLKRYPASLVARYNDAVRSGAPYRHEDLLAVQAALQNTPYFSSANVTLAPTEPRGEADPDDKVADAVASTADTPQEVPVLIQLRERAPFNVAFGAGVSSNTGARVEGGFRNADFLNRAWELNTGARIEQLRQSAYADIFLPPDRKRGRDSLGMLGERSDIQGLGIERLAVGTARTETRGSIEQRLGFNWQHELKSPADAPSSVNQALTATAGWVWRHADDPLDASEGIVAQFQLGGAAKALLSDQNFLRTYFRYSQGIPLGKSASLLLRGEVGVTAAKTRHGIPQDYLFRAGGSNSVRGYAYQSLGVKEGATTQGGRYLLAGSAEYTHWLDEQWGVATFIDAGQAADDRREVLTLATGYGLGARWKSPAGPLAVDLAWGQREGKLRLHFSLAVPF